jgi:hypothetical protein
VPLVAAAICPTPPLIVPQLAAGAASELDGLRAACDAAITRVTAAEPEVLVAVGAGTTTGELPPPYRASFRPWGAPVQVTHGEPGGTQVRDLALAVGLWMLARHELNSPVRVHAVAADADPDDCARLGRQLAGAGRVGLLVLGDGAACHGEKAPGYENPDAAPFDRDVRAAVDAGDPAGLRAIDAARAAGLRATGRAPWQVLAGAADGRSWRAESTYDAPYGVGYLVASWT